MRFCRLWSKGAAGSKNRQVLALAGGRAQGSVPRRAATHGGLRLGACSSQVAEFRGLDAESHRYPALPPCTVLKVRVSGMKRIIFANNPPQFTRHLSRFPATQSPSLSATSKQAEEELVNRSTVPSATPASMLLISHLSITTPRETSEPHLPQGQGAGRRCGVTGRQRGDQQQDHQP